MHSWIEIDAAALRHNFQIFAKLLGPDKLAPVLKSNAYGHGLSEVYTALRAEKPAWICTNYLFEGQQLRNLGYQGRILVLGPLLAEEIAPAAQGQIDVLLANPEILAAWKASPQKPNVHIKFDTGMSRQGFLPDQANEVASQLKPHLSHVVGVSTHFANVEDVLEHDYGDLQIQRLETALKVFRDQGFKVLAHAASSASGLLLKESRYDLVRVGISLYGMWPSPSTRLSFLQQNQKVADLLPVLSWKSKLSTVKAVREGDFIGYGCTFRASRDMRVAVVPVGYYEGFPRIAANGQSFVLVRGSRCRLVGRLCMNMMIVDVSHLPEASFGDEVILLGTAKKDQISAAELAGWSQSIHYELLTRLNPLIPRRLIGA